MLFSNRLRKKLCPFLAPSAMQGSWGGASKEGIDSEQHHYMTVSGSFGPWLGTYFTRHPNEGNSNPPRQCGYYQFLPGCCCCCCPAIMCLNYKLNTAVTTAGCWPGLAGSYRHNRKMLNYIVRWPILRIHIYYLHYLHILSTRFHFWSIPVFSLMKFTQLSHLTVLFHLSWCRAQTRQTAAVSRQHSEM